MADKQDGFALVCRRMQALLQEQATPIRKAACPPLAEMIQRLGTISLEQRAV